MFAVLLLAPAWAAPEAELVRRFLDAPVAAAELDAAAAEARALGTGVPLLDAPAVEARHEEARGPAGNTTNAIGGSLTVDLGLSPLGETRAARLRGTAGEHRRAALALQAVCDFRRDTTDLWAASAAAEVTGSGQERLEALLTTLGALAEAGEASGYDRDRAALAVSAHRVAALRVQGEAEALRARVSALLDAPVDGIELAPTPPFPEREDLDRLLASHPALEALQVTREAEDKAVGAARRDLLPDLTVGAARRWDAVPGTDAFTPGYEVGAAVGLPLLDSSRAELRQAVATRATAEARLARGRAELTAGLQAAWERAAALTVLVPDPTDPEALWRSATERYTAGETSLDELLQTAEAVEDALLARVERERLLRRARLDLACAAGRFDEPEIQSVLEEIR